jgi:polyisoprenoid-binding protein YceI
MNMKVGLFAVGFLIICGFVLISQWKYVPEKADIKFKVYTKKNEVEAEGVLTGLKGVVQFDSSNLKEAQITASVDVKTINSGIEMRDESLRSADFFDANKYPQISFTSTSITKEKENYMTKGTLKIKSISKEIMIPFKFIKETDETACFQGTFFINRLEYKVGSLGDGIGEKIEIQLVIPIKK